MEPGIYSIPFEQYEAIPVASKHLLDSLAVSPLHCWAYNVNPERQKGKQTPAKLLGNAIHTSILEPERFDKEYIEEPQPPEGSLVTLDDYKEYCRVYKLPVSGTKEALRQRLILGGMLPDRFWDKEYEKIIKGKKVLSTPDWRVTKAITARVRKHPSASELLKYGKAEQSIFWIDQDTGVPCKGRIDWLVHGEPIIFDLKSTQDASPIGFQRSIARYRYYVQAAMYIDGLSTLGYSGHSFVFAAWEKHSPYASTLYYATDTMLEEGRKEYRRLLRIYADCLSKNKWPGYSNDIQPIDLPRNFESETSPESELEDSWLERMGSE